LSLLLSCLSLRLGYCYLLFLVSLAELFIPPCVWLNASLCCDGLGCAVMSFFSSAVLCGAVLVAVLCSPVMCLCNHRCDVLFVWRRCSFICHHLRGLVLFFFVCSDLAGRAAAQLDGALGSQEAHGRGEKGPRYRETERERERGRECPNREVD
jgi:hypothetical protein